MFEVGRIYRRRDLHRDYGGNEQTGISTPAHQPFIFLFAGEAGKRHGYSDGWTSEWTYSYTGEGQTGDMAFKGRNLAVLDHAVNGEDLHLFENVGKQMFRYEGQMVCGGYQIIPNQPDRDGQPRRIIQFHLIRLEHLAQNEDADEWGNSLNEPVSSYSALAPYRAEMDSESTSEVAKHRAIARSQATRRIVLERANGRCEACGQDAPFIGSDGKPYLEPHHVRRLTDGGPDDPAWVIALCPNCHRHAHHGIDREAFTAALHDVLRNLGGGHSLQRASQP